MLPIDIEIPAALGLLEGGGQKKLREQDLFPEEPFFLGAASNKKKGKGSNHDQTEHNRDRRDSAYKGKPGKKRGKKVEPRPAAALIKPEMRAPF